MATLLRAIDEPSATRTAYWAGVLTDVFRGLNICLDQPPDARDSLLLGTAGPLQVLDSRSGPGAAWRTMRQVRRHDPDRYLVFVQAEGTSQGEHLDRCAEFEPGDWGLVDLSAPMRCDYTARRAVMITWPKALSPLREDQMAAMTGQRIHPDHGAAGLVSSLVRQLPEHLDDEDPAAGAGIASAVLDLVHVGLAGQLEREAAVDPRTHRRTLLTRCRGFIESHLGDPGLTPAAVAAAHHISLRYLHRIFEESGDGVAGLIRRRRLDRCRRDLLDPSLADRSAAAIGARWGFPDAAHFSRAFKRAYGLPPAGYRREFGLDLAAS